MSVEDESHDYFCSALILFVPPQTTLPTGEKRNEVNGKWGKELKVWPGGVRIYNLRVGVLYVAAKTWTRTR